MDRATPDPGEVDFVYNFQSNGCTYRLQLPLEVPYRGVPRELAVRLVKAHRIPCHLEDDLCERLVEFISTSSLDVLDQLAERSLYGGSVFEKVFFFQLHPLPAPPPTHTYIQLLPPQHLHPYNNYFYTHPFVYICIILLLYNMP